MAERFWVEKCYSERTSLKEEFNFKDLEENNWTYYDFCLDCSFFGEIAQHGLYKVQAKSHFETWLNNMDKKDKVPETQVSSCPRHNINNFSFFSGGIIPHKKLCNSLEDKPYGLPEEVQVQIRQLFLMHEYHLIQRRESVFFTPEQSERLEKVKSLGIDDIRNEQILQGEEPAKNPYISEPIKDFSHPYSKFCARNLMYGYFSPFFSVKEYRQNEDLLVGYQEEIFEKDISSSFRKHFERSSYQELDENPRIEVNYYTFSYKDFLEMLDNNPNRNALVELSDYENVLFSDIDLLKSIKVRDDFSEDQEMQQKELAIDYLTNENLIIG